MPADGKDCLGNEKTKMKEEAGDDSANERQALKI